MSDTWFHMVKNRIWENSSIYYSISFFLGGGLTLCLFLLFGATWMLEFPVSLVVSLIVARFIAGLGIPLIWSTICIYILKTMPKFKGTFLFKGKKKEVERLIRLLNIGGILLIIGIVGVQLMLFFFQGFMQNIFSMLGLPHGKGSFSVLAFSSMIGMSSFMLTTYILPTWKEEPEIHEERGIKEKIKGKFDDLKRKVAKGYWKYLRRDFLKAHLKEYIVFRSRFDKQRREISWIMLLPLAIGLLSLPVVSVPAIFFWWRLFKRPEHEYIRTEKYLLIIFLLVSTVWLAIVLSPFAIVNFPEFIQRPLWVFPYITGAILAFYLFTHSTLWSKISITH